MKSNKFGYLIHEGLKSIVTHGFMSFATVTIVVACLVIMGSFTLIAVNVASMLDDLESENEMIAYVEETLTEEEARALQSEIEYISNVSSCEFVTREQAMEEFASQYDDDSLFEDVDSSVFRHRFIIYLNDISLMEETKEALEDITGVAKVSAYLEVAEGFVTVRNVMSAVSLVLIVVLVVVCVFIMSNTVKLATYSRRDEIAIMKMVGASNWFIRFPFVVEGLVLGLLGGFLAYLLEWGLYDVVANRIMSGLMGSLLTVVSFSAMSAYVLVIYLAVGLVVGVFGSSVAIRNYLQV
ncbi:MAG: permease-like cell division protein FtsX [Oscillospiraceae bacterium]|nr:permease-like cell division protein FtsX [Oscillospiraceae bacterium]